jgi:hypothetical protein
MGLDFEKLAWTGIAVAALVFVAGVSPALGIQPTVEKITQEADGTATYHLKIKIDETIRVEGQGKEPNPDFFTIFNFTGMVPGSEKQPPGCFRPQPTESRLTEADAPSSRQSISRGSRT